MSTSKNANTLIDVRSPEEYQSHHLQGALNIPLDEIVIRLANFKTMSPPVYVYCRSGARSRMAATLLKKGGINNVIDAGGIIDAKKLLDL